MQHAGDAGTFHEADGCIWANDLGHLTTDCLTTQFSDIRTKHDLPSDLPFNRAHETLKFSIYGHLVFWYITGASGYSAKWTPKDLSVEWGSLLYFFE